LRSNVWPYVFLNKTSQVDLLAWGPAGNLVEALSILIELAALKLMFRLAAGQIALDQYRRGRHKPE
jgi:hypothetical protein